MFDSCIIGYEYVHYVSCRFFFFSRKIRNQGGEGIRGVGRCVGVGDEETRKKLLCEAVTADTRKVCFEDLSIDIFLEVQNETCS